MSFHIVRNRFLLASELALVDGLAAIAVVPMMGSALSVSHPTVSGSFILVVLVVATASTQRVSIGTSLMAFACSNFDVGVLVASANLRIDVRGRGPGLSAGDLQRVFEHRGEESRQTRGGTRMELSITRGLLAAAGGHVRAEDTPDGGAIFTMSAPIASRRGSLEANPT